MSGIQKTILGVQIKRTEIIIGDEVLELREPGMLATHEIVDLLFDTPLVDAVSKVGELIMSMQGQELTGIGLMIHNAPTIVGIFKDAVVPLMSKKAGLIVAVALDVKANRERLSMSSSDLRTWIQEELSMSQGAEVLVAMKDLIDWSDLTKKLKTLLPASLLTVKERPAISALTS